MSPIDYRGDRIPKIVSGNFNSITPGIIFSETANYTSTKATACYRLTSTLTVDVPLVIHSLSFYIPYADSYQIRLVAGGTTSTTTQIYELSPSTAKSTGWQAFELVENVLLINGINYYIQINCGNQRQYNGATQPFNGTYFNLGTTWYNTTAWSGYCVPMIMGGYVVDLTPDFNIVKM